MFKTIYSKLAVLLMLPVTIIALLAAIPEPVNEVFPKETPQKTFVPLAALDDPDNKISSDFKIPEELKARTQFWFEIYTKYGRHDHVIHHVRFPWIVYRVVNTYDIESNLNWHRWTRYHKARKEVQKTLTSIQQTLKRLAYKKTYQNLNRLEQELFDSLADVKGSRKNVFLSAANNVRSQLGQRDFILTGLAESRPFMPLIEKMFTSAGLPVELSRLPFVESSFNTHAYSKVGASGIWQIMPRTAKKYLVVNEHIDERNSPIKATEAAIGIFKENYRVLGRWDFALAGYNHGAYGIKRAVKKIKAASMIDIINKNKSESFQFASANFYPSFLAMLHAYEYRERINTELYWLAIDGSKSNTEYVLMKTKRRLRTKELTKLTGVTSAELSDLNPDLVNAIKSNLWLPKGFRIFLPLSVDTSRSKNIISSSN
jgi:membrane-bound lytic murein transglycosylase D